MPPLMTMLIKQPERLKMLEIALKDKHPMAYGNMKKNGDLLEYVAGLEQAMMETYDEEASRALNEMSRDKNSPRNPIEWAQKLEMKWAVAWEKILHHYLQTI